LKNSIKKIVLSGVVATSLVGSALMADDDKVGFGVSVAGDDTTKIRADFQIEDDFRLEPYIGFDYTIPDQGDDTYTMMVGTGAHFLKEVTNDTLAYYGAYAELIQSDDGTNSDTQFGLGPVVGVEYSFAKDFSIGAEASLKMTFGDSSKLETASAILFRYYLDD
jgi:hypothetical protein